MVAKVKHIWDTESGGDKAEKDGFPTVARLFMATSDAEEVHATLH